MSAGRLREAATLMRERAEGVARGPWSSWVEGRDGSGGDDFILTPSIDIYVNAGSKTSGQVHAAHQDHIASWHPAVARAVADWLVLVADGEHTGGLNWRPGGEAWCALAVADAYLGGDS